ncbi:CDP-glycerol glycerophosphotransferase family protein [Lacimicrobium alkaliphilum]|uniref:CDP-glycerol--glycerophosphate glycerophosphotransferase n=1 Tax=Lacimicrobium alkaliphilum TaxID=1526571 RepID=A0ABQ1RT60_9ALTE|nr:CDP-glycerol glycerophosphotransferase family protein [Lacimicrobium alkaliphilum]GGD77357.1 CDP-glycerol--glycerophosphate glycerophosphotransferase [Lacimicrobium alkaliphilum]
MNHYLFYISQNYAFEILRPLQAEIHRRGDKVHWFTEGKEVNKQLFLSDESVLDSVADVISVCPRAVFVPGNYVPSFIPGLKVQVFHGFEWKKKGHFRIRDCFDLYCTQGPLFTRKFEQLQLEHPYFRVLETGWPKTDPLFSVAPYTWPTPATGPLILYAPTFSPSLTSAPALYEQIKKLSEENDLRWLIKFHPKMDKQWIQAYKALQHDRLIVAEDSSINPLLLAADIMLSDTSSAITEFCLLKKPVVTFNNLQPEAQLLDISDPEMLPGAIQQASAPSIEWKQAIEANISQLHPYTDGHSSARILNAVDDTIALGREGLKSKPVNLFRQLKMRLKLGYWGR